MCININGHIVGILTARGTNVALTVTIRKHTRCRHIQNPQMDEDIMNYLLFITRDISHNTTFIYYNVQFIHTYIKYEHTRKQREKKQSIKWNRRSVRG